MFLAAQTNQSWAAGDRGMKGGRKGGWVNEMEGFDPLFLPTTSHLA